MNRQSFLKETAVAALLTVLAVTLAAPAMAQSRRRGPAFGSGPSAIAPLTQEEAQWLYFMREEEKLARDVYQQLFEEWNLVVFDNIAASEQAHFDAIGKQLTKYGATDPAEGLDAGVYSDPKLVALYSQLMAKGMASAQDALEVGVLIEKTDIEDLEAALFATDKSDIKRVYTNLMNGSYSHLEAFESGCDVLAATN